MKTKLFILLLFSMTIVPIASGQRLEAPTGYRSLYFDREDYISTNGDTIVYLYEKGNRFEPKKVDIGLFIPGAFEFNKDAFSLFQEEFPDLNYPDDLWKFRGVELCLWTDYEGNIISFYYRFYSDKSCIYPDLEKHLYDLAVKIKKAGFKKYDIRSMQPGVYSCFYYNMARLYRDYIKFKKH